MLKLNSNKDFESLAMDEGFLKDLQAEIINDFSELFVQQDRTNGDLFVSFLIERASLNRFNADGLLSPLFIAKTISLISDKEQMSWLAYNDFDVILSKMKMNDEEFKIVILFNYKD